MSSNRKTGIGMNPTRTSPNSSSGSPCSLTAFLLDLLPDRPQDPDRLRVPLQTHLPASFHCRKPLASEVPARSIRSWLPKDHFEEGFAGLLIRAFAHRSGSCFEEKSWTIFSSSELARSLQGVWTVVVGATAAWMARQLALPVRWLTRKSPPAPTAALRRRGTSSGTCP